MTRRSTSPISGFPTLGRCVTALALPFLLALSMVGCGGSSTGTDAPAAASSSTTEAAVDTVTSSVPPVASSDGDASTTTTETPADADAPADDGDDGSAAVSLSEASVVEVPDVIWWNDAWVEAPALYGVVEVEGTTGGCEGGRRQELAAWQLAGDGSLSVRPALDDGARAGDVTRLEVQRDHAVAFTACEGFVALESVVSARPDETFAVGVPIAPIDAGYLSVPVWGDDGSYFMVDSFDDSGSRTRLTVDATTGQVTDRLAIDWRTLAEMSGGEGVVATGEGFVVGESAPFGNSNPEMLPAAAVSPSGELVALWIGDQLLVANRQGEVGFTATATSGAIMDADWLDDARLAWTDNTDTVSVADVATGTIDTVEPGGGGQWFNLAVADHGRLIGLAGYRNNAPAAVIIDLR